MIPFTIKGWSLGTSTDLGIINPLQRLTKDTIICFTHPLNPISVHVQKTLAAITGLMLVHLEIVNYRKQREYLTITIFHSVSPYTGPSKYTNAVTFYLYPHKGSLLTVDDGYGRHEFLEKGIKTPEQVARMIAQYVQNICMIAT